MPVGQFVEDLLGLPAFRAPTLPPATIAGDGLRATGRDRDLPTYPTALGDSRQKNRMRRRVGSPSRRNVSARIVVSSLRGNRLPCRGQCLWPLMTVGMDTMIVIACSPPHDDGCHGHHLPRKFGARDSIRLRPCPANRWRSVECSMSELRKPELRPPPALTTPWDPCLGRGRTLQGSERLAGGDHPDVNVADIGKAWNGALQILFNLLRRSIGGCTFEQDMHGISQERPGAAQDQQADETEENRVYRGPTRIEDDNGCDDRRRLSQASRRERAASRP